MSADPIEPLISVRPPPYAAQRPFAPRNGVGALLAKRGWTIALVLLAIATIAIRARYFGNPIVDADEEFYLLTGDRLLHGALPYVDIWDRKPIGLFLLFAAIRLLGGDGVLAYQLVACAFVIATVVLIAVMARRIAPAGAALVAALAYVPSLGLSGGQGGQTPVFYDLLVAGAAFLILRLAAPLEGRSHPSPRATGAAAMLLIGVAMQIKYTAVFEGLYFGLALLWLGRREGRRPATRALDAGLWVAAAIAPTLAAWLAYAALGHGGAFLYANFGSIFARAGLSGHDELHNLGHVLGRIAPLLVPVIVAEWLLRPDTRLGHPTGVAAHRFLAGWLIAAFAGFLIFGSYFNHYALPLLPPLAVLAAPAFAIRRRRIGMVLATILTVGLLAWYAIAAHKNDVKKGDAAYGYALAGRIRPLLHGRCLFIFYGEPIFYHLAGSCLLTRWPFPYHLSLTRESAALGVDPATEMRRILAERPSAILDTITTDPEVNLPVQAILHDALHRQYRLVYAFPHGGRVPQTDELWARLPGR